MYVCRPDVQRGGLAEDRPLLAHPDEDEIHSLQNKLTELQAEIAEIRQAMRAQQADHEELHNLHEELNALRAELHTFTDGNRRVFVRDDMRAAGARPPR